ncbi:MAG: 4Fe-4S binding protein [Deltaproteobacteria bacterium]|nr:4Fe-4S binding protein [Deltaproteobacteria bacterium]
MKTLRKIVEIDEEKCDGCGLCVPSCAEGAIKIINGKAKLIAEKYCDGLGACLGECPRDAIHIVEREVDEFDEEAVKEHLQPQPAHSQKPTETSPRGCPSAHIHSFNDQSVNKPLLQPETSGKIASALSHWPVQIRLVPPHAPFLKNADLLVAADCSPMAYGDFHRDLLAGKVVMMGCPKFDDIELYEERFRQIFSRAEVKSVTILVMEVPCCQGLPAIIKKALKDTGSNIPLEIITIGLQGKILQRNAFPGGVA